MGYETKNDLLLGTMIKMENSFEQENILPGFGENQVNRCGPTEGTSTKARFSKGMGILVKSKL